MEVKDEKKTRPCDYSHDGATIANLGVPIASTSNFKPNMLEHVKPYFSIFGEILDFLKKAEHSPDRTDLGC